MKDAATHIGHLGAVMIQWTNTLHILNRLREFWKILLFSTSYTKKKELCFGAHFSKWNNLVHTLTIAVRWKIRKMGYANFVTTLFMHLLKCTVFVHRARFMKPFFSNYVSCKPTTHEDSFPQYEFWLISDILTYQTSATGTANSSY
jgi:hypothetical protein